MIKMVKTQILFSMKLIKTLLKLFLLLLLGGILFAFGYYYAVTKNVSLSPEKLTFNEKSILFYDANGEVVRDLSTSILQQSVSIKTLPRYAKQAFVDTEDKRFYKHDGYDVKRILRASINNLKAQAFKEGASTISQQLIKNTHLSQEKTLKRKLKEWKLTRALENDYTKEEILERYLNTIYFGHNCFGIASASQFYFGKSPSELTLSDSAILAGLIKSPNNYSPFKNPENCLRRKSIVLSSMLKNGSITEKQRADALQAPLPLSTASKPDGGYLHFAFDELSSLAEEKGFKIGGKIEIFTYLDSSLQKEIEEIAKSYSQSDKTLLVLDGKTHGYKACVSTTGNITRMPGSLIKPLLVYAPAMEENVLSPATPILDAKINYSGYSPENYDGKYHGYVSARTCVEKSLNIPAVKVLESLTVQKGAAYLQKLGLNVEKEDKSLALALGGMKNGYTLTDLTSAYSTLQNNGIKENCGFISLVKINDAVVYKKTTEKTRVFSEETSWLMTDMLKSTAKQGTAKKLRSLPFEIAAKTGTVGTKSGNTDAYALSYTSLDCAAVWLGNATNDKIECTGGGEPCNLLYQINLALAKNYQRENQAVSPFAPNEKVCRVALDKASYYDTHTLSLADELSPETERIFEWFKKSAIPLNKSTSFTCPSISPPQISIENNGIKISFDAHLPSYYTYKIERSDYVSHTTVYEGKYLPFFLDEDVINDKHYVYTVTPFYQDRAGTSIVLPSVSLKGKLEKNDDDILSKEWWKY